MSNIQKQHKISPAIAWLTIQKFIIFYCPLDGEHTTDAGDFFAAEKALSVCRAAQPRMTAANASMRAMSKSGSEYCARYWGDVISAPKSCL